MMSKTKSQSIVDIPVRTSNQPLNSAMILLPDQIVHGWDGLNMLIH